MTNEAENRLTLYALIAMAVEDLTNVELAQLNVCAQRDRDPRQHAWYSKVADLFDRRDGTRMHDASKQALAAIVIERLAPA